MVTTNTRNKWNIIEMETGPHTASNANCIVFVFDISSIWGEKKCNIVDETDKKTFLKTKQLQLRHSLIHSVPFRVKQGYSNKKK